MTKTYQYDPTNIEAYTVDRMRLELGDTQVEGEESTAALCDEEYQGIINTYFNNNRGSWALAKFKCLEAIFMRLSYEADFEIGGMSVDLSKRFEHWQKLYQEQKKAYQGTVLGKGVLPSSVKGQLDGGHYFYNGMLGNTRSR
ncbi:MAG: hypothetical protein HFI72_05805 [Peptococcaceae bacterium]|nr:hypothetical protein [Peptococcaceae bacterium]